MLIENWRHALNKSCECGHSNLVQKILDARPDLDIKLSASWIATRNSECPHLYVLKYFQELTPGISMETLIYIIESNLIV